eukprot:gnl/TRDRNA2_/TRDRNA2_170120_c0_seq1.p1 gnl/TRDRNA2_/TRDRNA2_170120_c0~~gnl/TRDRNA2_/TRDRNA2_170120_c0_seq1.p1  ORF type:complete len:394 (+),score=11.28 gnl/TRDRNA2_/TRDRNA2_170120_c0_seq1:106-1287(+)
MTKPYMFEHVSCRGISSFPLYFYIYIIICAQCALIGSAAGGYPSVSEVLGLTMVSSAAGLRMDPAPVHMTAVPKEQRDPPQILTFGGFSGDMANSLNGDFKLLGSFDIFPGDEPSVGGPSEGHQRHATEHARKMSTWDHVANAAQQFFGLGGDHAANAPHPRSSASKPAWPVYSRSPIYKDGQRTDNMYFHKVRNEWLFSTRFSYDSEHGWAYTLPPLGSFDFMEVKAGTWLPTEFWLKDEKSNPAGCEMKDGKVTKEFDYRRPHHGAPRLSMHLNQRAPWMYSFSGFRYYMEDDRTPDGELRCDCLGSFLAEQRSDQRRGDLVYVCPAVSMYLYYTEQQGWVISSEFEPTGDYFYAWTGPDKGLLETTIFEGYDGFAGPVKVSAEFLYEWVD